MAGTGVESAGALATALGRWARRLLPDPVRGERLSGDLLALVGGDLDPAAPVTAEVLAEVERVCHRTARHLTLELHPDAQAVDDPDGPVPHWPPVPAAEVDARAGGVRVVRRDGGAGELRVDGFDEVAAAGTYLRAAATLLRGCDGLVLDLRANGGGAPSSLALLAELVLGPGPTLLATVHRRAGEARQWWTTGSLGERTLAVDARVAVLVGPGTYSSGEALAYHLQVRGAVRTFGGTTPGAADHVVPVRVTPRVTALVPEATPVDPVSGASWEGTGVVPDVPCDPDDEAPARARAWVARGA